MTKRPTRASGAPRTGANAPRVLLIEDSSLLAVDATEAHERLVALQAAGALVRAIAVGSTPLAEDGGHEAGDTNGHVVAGETAELVPLSALSQVVRGDSYDLILIASPLPHGGTLARHLLRDRRALWIPTGFAAPTRWTLQRAIPSAFGHERAAKGGGLGGCVVVPVRGGRAVLPLWDGDYALVPASLEGRAGGEALAAFASIADERSDLDLVVLADPQPSFEQLALRLGVGPRVHFVGRAPRGAQRAWWAMAAAAVFAGERPIAGGVVLRGLEARCPLLAASSGAAATLGHWLTALELSPSRRPGAAPLASALGEALDRGDATRAAIERGVALTREHDATALTTRFAAVLKEGTAARRAA